MGRSRGYFRPSEGPDHLSLHGRHDASEVVPADQALRLGQNRGVLP